MTSERIVRLVAGFMVLLSLSLTRLHHPAWFWLTGFVGLNLFQSALTRWCLLEDILRSVGVRSCCRDGEGGSA